MKVLIVNPIMYSNETDNIKKVRSLKDTLMYNVCIGFLENNIYPTLIVSEDFKPTCNEKYPFQIIFFKTKLKKIFYPRIIPYLSGFKKYLKKNKNTFDFAVCSESFSIATFTTCRILKNKVIVWQEMAKHQKKFHKVPSIIWHNFIVRFFYKKSLIVARSENARTFISKYSNNVSNTIVEHGMDIEKFPCQLDKTTNQFIVVSQLIERKQINLIIDKFSKFLKKYDNYSLIICGIGPLEEKLKKECEVYGINKNVHFLGQCDHEKISELYRLSKALLVYTKQDNNMVSIIESICSGTPVLTTSIPYNSSYIAKYNLGLVKDNWTEYDLEILVKNNIELKRNCCFYRENLSSKKSAEMLTNIFMRSRGD